MKQIFLEIDTGDITLIKTPKPIVKPNYVIVETLYSAISSGTEGSLAKFGEKNLLQKIKERPDQAKQVFDKMQTDGIINTLEGAISRLKEPLPLGYSAMGRVIEVGEGVYNVKKDDYVAIAGSAYHSEINRVGKNLVIKIPENLENKKQAALVALGAIAIHSIHQADVKPGEIVGVIGLGLLGHILSRVLNAYGCDVIAYDINNSSNLLTPLKSFMNINDRNIINQTKLLTQERGLDKIIITASTNSNQPIEVASKLASNRAIITMVGVGKINIDRSIFYEKELNFNIVRSYGPGRYDSIYEESGVDYPYEYIKFTEGRNLQEFIRLLADKRVDVSDLITKIYDFDDYKLAYQQILKKNSEDIAVLFKYSDDKNKLNNKITYNKTKVFKKEKVEIGLVGPGRFASNVILPYMKKTNEYHFRGVASTGGINSAKICNNFLFDYSTNNYKDLMNDRNIDLIIIATEHDSHSKLVIESLEANKHVYVEKPLCLNLKELEKIKQIYKKSGKKLFVGFNRRYSSKLNELKKQMDDGIKIYEYFVNAGKIDSANWAANPQLSGGRLMGEALHFIDTLNFLDESDIVDINIMNTDTDNLRYSSNFALLLKYSSGSIGIINYNSLGNKKFPKELIRVSNNGKIIELKNYIKVYHVNKIVTFRFNLRQDKGFLEQYKNISSSVKNKINITHSFDDLYKIHKIILRYLENEEK